MIAPQTSVRGSLADMAFVSPLPLPFNAISATPNQLQRRPRSQNVQAVRRRVPAMADASTTSEQAEQPIPAPLEASIRAYISENAEAAAAPSPLAYLTLRDFGRTDLVEPIMAAGGYISVSRQLGIRVDDAYSTYRPPRRPEELPSVFSKADDGGSLALGAGRAARLNVDVSSITPREPLGEASVPSAPSEADMSVRSGVLPYAPAPVPTAEEVASIGKDIVVVVDKVVPEGERLALTASMRAGTLLLVGASAAGFGHASRGLLDSRALDALQSGSVALGVGHVILAIYAAAILAPSFNRSAAVWGLKVFLSGPAGVVSLRQYGPLEDAASE